MFNRTRKPPPLPPVEPGLPKSFVPYDDETGVARARIFDPSLKQYPKAFRQGDPTFTDPAQALRWRAARRLVMERALAAVVASPFGRQLVLRGSLVLPAWLGDAAREPRDMDWVVLPATQKIDEKATERLFTGLEELLRGRAVAEGIAFDPKGIRTDEIWTYDRVPGRRIVFPWRAVGLPAGSLQMDLVFGEELATPPVLTHLPISSGSSLEVLTASLPLSLAWKLQWLHGDLYPQGKDLYDAVLLAERTKITRELLVRVIPPERDPRHRLTVESMRGWNVDWDDFHAEYPWIEGTRDYWIERLVAAVGPVLT